MEIRKSSSNIGEGGLEGNTAKYPPKLVALHQSDSQKSQVPLRVQEK